MLAAGCRTAAPGPGKGSHLPANRQGMRRGANEQVLDRGDQNSCDYCSAAFDWLSTVSTRLATHQRASLSPPPQLIVGNFSIKPPLSTNADSASSSAGPTIVTGRTSSESTSGECQVTMLGHMLSTIGLITYKLAERRHLHWPHSSIQRGSHRAGAACHNEYHNS